MTNCFEWTPWATQQEKPLTMEIPPKDLALLNFSIDPRFHFVWFSPLEGIFHFWSGEEHFAPAAPLADHCPWLLRPRSLHVFSWCIHFFGPFTAIGYHFLGAFIFWVHLLPLAIIFLVPFLFWPITALGYYGLALSMSSLGANIFLVHSLPLAIVFFFYHLLHFATFFLVQSFFVPFTAHGYYFFGAVIFILAHHYPRLLWPHSLHVLYWFHNFFCHSLPLAIFFLVPSFCLPVYCT